jgi:hypothetical protein
MYVLVRLCLEAKCERIRRPCHRCLTIRHTQQQLVRTHAPCDSTIEDLRGLVKSLESQLQDARTAAKTAQDERNKVRSDGWVIKQDVSCEMIVLSDAMD